MLLAMGLLRVSWGTVAVAVLFSSVGMVLPPLVVPATAAPTPVAVTITKVRCVDPCDEQGLEALLESTPDFFARIWINGTLMTPPRGPENHAYLEPFWTVSATIPDGQPSFTVGIQIWDEDDAPGGDDLADASPLGGDNNLDIVVDTATGRWTGDINWPKSCAIGGEPGGEPAVEVCFDISIDSLTGDADGDGLLDGWERNGLDADGDGTIDLPLPAWGANPLRQDLFLELDSEAGQTPSRAAIQAMKRAFAAAPRSNPVGPPGISLWIDTGLAFDPTANEAGPAPNCDDRIDNDGNGLTDGDDPACFGPGGTVSYLDSAVEGLVGNCGDGIDNDGDGPDGADPQCLVGDNLGGGGTIPTVGACARDAAFFAAKNAPSGFSPLRRWVFRYAISAARAPTCAGASGGDAGQIGGRDFIEFNHDGGTLMHELGHTLGLRHGGNEDLNCKPNYVSVMNYDNQIGINRRTGGAIIDYSPPRRALDGSTRDAAPIGQLVENALSELMVLDPADGLNQFVFSTAPGVPLWRTLNRNPNWNNDVDPPLEASFLPAPGFNINTGTLPGCANIFTNEVLRGFDDWSVISLPFRQFADAGAGGGATPDEPTLEQLLKHRDAGRHTDLALAVVDTPNPVAAGAPLTYTITVTNKGPNPTSSVQVVDTLPSQSVLTSSTPACRLAGSVLTCNLDPLEAGDSTVVTIVTAVPPNLVYDNGGPLTLVNRAEVRSLLGDDTAPADNLVDESTLVQAMADLSMVTFEVPNPPIEMQVGENVVVGLLSTIMSVGPSSPMDTALLLEASASSGASVTPTRLTTAQPRMITGTVRSVSDYLIVRCSVEGRYSFRLQHSIRPLLAADINLNPGNDARNAGFEVHCKGGRREVTINVLPGSWPNEVFVQNQEMSVAIMTTRAGEYGRPAFDATTVVEDTLRFGPPAILDTPDWGVSALPGRTHPENVPEPVPPEATRDGDADLSTWFAPNRSGLRPGDTRACIVGRYRDGGEERPFFGCDAVEVR